MFADDIVRNKKHDLRRNASISKAKQLVIVYHEITHLIGHTGPIMSPDRNLSAFITIGLAEMSTILF